MDNFDEKELHDEICSRAVLLAGCNRDFSWPRVSKWMQDPALDRDAADNTYRFPEVWRQLRQEYHLALAIQAEEEHATTQRTA